MKLNTIEFLLMNNPFRSYIQEKYELPKLMNMLPSTAGNFDSVLEIGCGSGNGSTLIKKYFNPPHITGVDLDEKMIRKAQERVPDTSMTFLVMDASKLSFADQTFDAVFNFGVIHHIPNWKDCISEVRRVLKHGGQLIMEDLSLDTFSGFPGRLWKLLLAHPYREMYSTGEFVDQLEKAGFIINDFKTSNPLKMIRYFSLVAG
ncbi:MAG: class I SAM-dependent methyltransferase, partial [bacterium]|nr:class I SAM-dependent methyltransferase [bacterium]